jgi:sugar-specific transcriptional regulator TrmB
MSIIYELGNDILLQYVYIKPNYIVDKIITTCQNVTMVSEILQQLGFNEKEIKIYLTVLEHGKMAPAQVARLTSINRTTVYAIAKELVAKGVITEDLAGTKSSLIALPPEDLKTLAHKEERELENKKILINQAIQELQSIPKNPDYFIPKITFIYEEDVKDFLYKQTSSWNESIMKTDGVYWGFQDPTFVQNFSDWIDWYWIQAPPKLVLKLLTNDSEFESEVAQRKYERRTIRFWNSVGNFTASTWVNGDYLIMVMTNKHPFYLVQIYDPTLAHNMREVFKGIWNTLEK